jgi:hypothetical protein
VGAIGLAACVIFLPPTWLAYVTWTGGVLLLLYVVWGTGLLKVATVLLLSCVRRQRLTIATRSVDGSIHCRCPKCGAKVELHDRGTGCHAFQCKNCGETAN